LNGNGKGNEYRNGKGVSKERTEERDDVKTLKKMAVKKKC
jgi:hypothetical protein